MDIPFIGSMGGGFSLDSAGKIGYYLGIGFLIFVGTIAVTFLFMFIFRALSAKKVIEINLKTKKIKEFGARMKKNPNGVLMLYIPKLKKYIPRIQEEDFLSKGKKEILLLIKDNNGMHHTARLPTYKELKQFYSKIYGVDNLKEYSDVDEVLNTIYLLPNPSEDLNWLAGQCLEAEKAFGDVWWKHPNVMILGCAFLGVMMIIIMAVIQKKM